MIVHISYCHLHIPVIRSLTYLETSPTSEQTIRSRITIQRLRKKLYATTDNHAAPTFYPTRSPRNHQTATRPQPNRKPTATQPQPDHNPSPTRPQHEPNTTARERKSVVAGKSVDPGCRRITKKKHKVKQQNALSPINSIRQLWVPHCTHPPTTLT